jgi:hypothetical protein
VSVGYTARHSSLQHYEPRQHQQSQAVSLSAFASAAAEKRRGDRAKQASLKCTAVRNCGSLQSNFSVPSASMAQSGQDLPSSAAGPDSHRGNRTSTQRWRESHVNSHHLRRLALILSSSHRHAPPGVTAAAFRPSHPPLPSASLSLSHSTQSQLQLQQHRLTSACQAVDRSLSQLVIHSTHCAHSPHALQPWHLSLPLQLINSHAIARHGHSVCCMSSCHRQRG